MIDKEEIHKYVESQLEGTDCFLVDVTVTPANDIEVLIDSPEGIDIDRCVELTRDIEKAFDRDKEDYSLQVGSAGLTSPFRVRRQYEMHIGDNVEVLYNSRKYRGRLESVGDDDFTVLVPEKVKEEGAKKPHIEDIPHTFRFSDIKYCKYDFDF